jgi:hypothetical protein
VRSKEKDKGLSKLLGGEVEKGFHWLLLPLASGHWKLLIFLPLAFEHWKLLIFLPLASKHWKFLLLLLLASEHWKLILFLPLATKLWIYLHFLSPSLEKAIRIIGGFSSKNVIFYSNLERTYSHNLLGRRIMGSLE